VVPVNTLDLIVNTRFDGQPLLIKMDVEGFEYDVLNGAVRTLNLSPRPTWLVEINLAQNYPGGRNDSFLRTFELFWAHGYESKIASRQEQPVNSSDVDRWMKQGKTDFGSYNYLFVQPQDHACFTGS
jgi:hypothetical protein